MNSSGNNRYYRPGPGSDGKQKKKGTVTDARTGAAKPAGQLRQYSSDGKRIERFNVHISEEDYENEISYDSKRGHREKRLAEQRKGNAQKFDEAMIARSDVPISRTRVITSRSGERYEIPEESNLPPKLLRKVKRNQRSRGCVVSVVYSAIIVSISVLLAFYTIVGINDMFGLVKDDIDIDVEIPQGADLNAVTRILDDNDVVDYPFFFKLYAELTNDDSFKHGRFTLNRKSDYDMIIRKLTRPATADKSIVTVLIPEGKNLMQIAEILEDNCVCEKEAFFVTLETHEWKHEFFKDIPKGRKSPGVTPYIRKNKKTTSPTDSDAVLDNYTYKMEGYLFPATYSFYIWEGSTQAINRMLNAFDENVINNSEVNFKNRVSDLNSIYRKKLGRDIDMDFIITMASIIEREAQNPEDMKNVASCFYNRMANPNTEGTGGKLQSDATLWYPFATKNVLTSSDLLSDEDKANFVSIYSTLDKAGLPQGPICCPGLNAINAALNPNDTNFLFFFSDPEGKFHFAATYNDFLAKQRDFGVG